MWHEARKQERKIRGMIVDYRKRAERRQDFYEKIKADPTQFIQIHGRKCKIHLDPAVAAAGDGAAIIVPWQGNEDNLIDRFDVRAHLETIPIPSKQEEPPLTADEHHCNYERYRILAQNEFLGIAEEKFLYQLRLEEQFGATAHVDCDKISSKKKSNIPRAAISYSYDTRDVPKAPVQQINATAPPTEPDSDSEIDMDVTIDVNELDTSQAHELNSCGRNYGMMGNDFYSFLTKDADEAIALKMAKEVEQEKIMLSGRKSRRERRVQREKRLSGKPLSPPSYAAKEDISSVAKGTNEDEESDSHSHSSDSSEKITFITSFGGEDELQAHSKITINVSKPTDRLGGGRIDRRSFTTKLPNNGSKMSTLKLALGSISAGNANQSTKKSSNHHSHHRSQSRMSSSYNRDHGRNIRERSPISSSRVTIPSNEPKVPVKDISAVTKHSGADLTAEKHASKFPSQSNLTIREKNSVTDASQTKINTDPVVPPIKRYYGRKRDDHSSSSDELTDYETNSPAKNTSGEKGEEGNSKESKIAEEPVGKTASTPSLTHSSCFQAKGQTNADKQNLRDRLKRKMQTLLNKQYKADKKAELERTERQIQQQQEREDEMRELALKLRKRQRELRHKYGSPSSETSSSSRSTCDETASKSKWKSSEFPLEKYRSRSRESRSRSYSHKDDDSPPRTHGYRSRRSRSGSRHRSNDFGSREYRSRDYDSKDYGGRDYGSKDYGNKDYRSKDYGSRDYGNKDSGSSRKNARVSRWDNDERERTRSPYSSHTQKYSNPSKRRYSRSRERLRARSRSPRR